MKAKSITLEGPYRSLARNIEKEGDIVTDGAELVLSPRLEWTFPNLVVEAMGYEMAPLTSESCLIFRWFDGDEWRPQVLVGFPLRTLMNEGLGCAAPAGMACRFTDRPDLSALFENNYLEESLREAKWKGFVTIGLGENLGVTRLMTGVPYWGLWNALEGVQGKITSFLSGEEPILKESWTTNLLLTRWPWPFKEKDERVFLSNFDDEIGKHFWGFDLTYYRRSCYVDGTMVGIATSWSPLLGEACRRSIRTLHNLDLPAKQFRTDLFKVAGDGWAKLSGRTSDQS